MNNAFIQRNNQQLGFETVFFYKDNGVISYTERGVIYLNTAYEKVDIANKREILHHFENHPYFKAIKIAIIKKLGKIEYQRLYKFYLNRYKDLYSKKEIKKGVLDNEIAIDAIIGNGHFNHSMIKFTQNFYRELITCLQKWADGKRYTNFTVDNHPDFEAEME